MPCWCSLFFEVGADWLKTATLMFFCFEVIVPRHITYYRNYLKFLVAKNMCGFRTFEFVGGVCLLLWNRAVNCRVVWVSHNGYACSRLCCTIQKQPHYSIGFVFIQSYSPFDQTTQRGNNSHNRSSELNKMIDNDIGANFFMWNYVIDCLYSNSLGLYWYENKHGLPQEICNCWWCVELF